jgi:hypothetical protein
MLVTRRKHFRAPRWLRRQVLLGWAAALLLLWASSLQRRASASSSAGPNWRDRARDDPVYMEELEVFKRFATER